jgi:predicted Zn-ribbon and HTH transcriptional regulator
MKRRSERHHSTPDGGVRVLVADEAQVEYQVLDRARRTAADARDRSCSECGYGIACTNAPARCPMCGSAAAWISPGRVRDRVESRPSRQ